MIEKIFYSLITGIVVAMAFTPGIAEFAQQGGWDVDTSKNILFGVVAGIFILMMVILNTE